MSDHHSGDGMSARKAQHLEICLDETSYHVESDRTRLNEVHLVHHSLPEVDATAVDTRVEFLGYRVAMPVFISSMTGGSAAGYQTNKDLAVVAGELGIPVGMGSMRILFRKPEVREHFLLKQFAPHVPVFTNLGGVQLPQMDHDEIYRAIESLGVDGIAIHLNPAQELFQPGGDRDFRGIADALGRFIERSPVPVLVKETGMGINPREVRTLQALGATYVNVAGSGGTNWARVEAYRQEVGHATRSVAEFDAWGLPTALILAAIGRHTRGILASGGLRTGMDVVNALALGAEACGMALPFVRALKTGGVAAAVEFGQRLEYVIRNAMVLANCETIDALRRAPLWMENALTTDAASLAGAVESR